MVLENEFNTNVNLKKIRRLMKKYGLECPIRQVNYILKNDESN